MPAEAAQPPPPDAGEGVEASALQAPEGPPPRAGIAVVTGSPSMVAGVPVVADHGLLEVIWEEPQGGTGPGIGRYRVLRDGSSSPAVAEMQVVVVVHSGSQ